MTITNIVKRINQRMNFDNFPYDDLSVALDSAIDRINMEWRINLPMITALPETSQEVDADTNTPTGRTIPTEYKNMPDDMIRMYVVPYVAGMQYITNEQDGSTEINEALLNLSRLSERYGSVAGSGNTEITDPNFKLLSEDTSDQFGDGNSNYNYPTKHLGYTDEELALNPLADLED